MAANPGYIRCSGRLWWVSCGSGYGGFVVWCGGGVVCCEGHCGSVDMVGV